MKKKYVTFKYVSEISTDDSLNSLAIENVLGKDIYETGFPHACIYIYDNGTWERVCARIKIEDVKSILSELEKSGANYVEIMYHSDHDGYEFNGVQVRPSTKEEISVFNEKNKRKKEIEEEFEKLNKQLEKLNKEYQKI